MDEAFCFYYEDNLRMLEKCGAQLLYFSPLHDTKLPKDCDAMLLGGGYPELYARELSKNVSMLNAIKKLLEPERRRLQSAEGLCIFTHIYIISVMIQMSKTRLMNKTKQIHKMMGVCRSLWAHWMVGVILRESWSGSDILSLRKSIAIFYRQMKNKGA